MSPGNDKIAHFFHRPAFREFQKSLIQAISLPIGARGQFHYGKVWVNESFKNETENINTIEKYPGLIWVLSCLERPEGERTKLEFSFACPIRYIEVLNIEEDEDNYFINFRAGKYVSNYEKKNKEELADFSLIAFDDNNIPYPGSERGFVHIGRWLEINTSETFSFNSLYSILGDIPSATHSQGKEPEIKIYPIIKLEDIEGKSTNEKGIYELKTDKLYKIPYRIHQGDKYRSRGISINKILSIGKTIKGEVSEKIKEEQNRINFEVEFSDIRIQIPFHIEAKKSLFKMKFTPLVILCIIAVIGFFLIPALLPASMSEGSTALLSAIIILMLGRFFETISK